ncbi:MAG TPA: hypothetical protein VMU12_00190 [Candidatus Paceibacterota bacterium]|nr:hypothetical protein [Candidatus Paceibacterota bacterium]
MSKPYPQMTPVEQAEFLKPKIDEWRASPLSWRYPLPWWTRRDTHGILASMFTGTTVRIIDGVAHLEFPPRPY